MADIALMDDVRTALLTAFIAAGPVLLAGALVGLLVGFLQAVTQVHDQTLAFVPKLVATVLVLIVSLPWLLDRLSAFATAMFSGNLAP